MTYIVDKTSLNTLRVRKRSQQMYVRAMFMLWSETDRTWGWNLLNQLIKKQEMKPVYSFCLLSFEREANLNDSCPCIPKNHVMYGIWDKGRPFNGVQGKRLHRCLLCESLQMHFRKNFLYAKFQVTEYYSRWCINVKLFINELIAENYKWYDNIITLPVVFYLCEILSVFQIICRLLILQLLWNKMRQLHSVHFL
jgi:hypothetical protein